MRSSRSRNSVPATRAYVALGIVEIVNTSIDDKNPFQALQACNADNLSMEFLERLARRPERIVLTQCSCRSECSGSCHCPQDDIGLIATSDIWKSLTPKSLLSHLPFDIQTPSAPPPSPAGYDRAPTQTLDRPEDILLSKPSSEGSYRIGRKDCRCDGMPRLTADILAGFRFGTQLGNQIKTLTNLTEKFHWYKSPSLIEWAYDHQWKLFNVKFTEKESLVDVLKAFDDLLGANFPGMAEVEVFKLELTNYIILNLAKSRSLGMLNAYLPSTESKIRDYLDSENCLTKLFGKLAQVREQFSHENDEVLSGFLVDLANLVVKKLPITYEEHKSKVKKMKSLGQALIFSSLLGGTLPGGLNDIMNKVERESRMVLEGSDHQSHGGHKESGSGIGGSGIGGSGGDQQSGRVIRYSDLQPGASGSLCSDGSDEIGSDFQEVDLPTGGSGSTRETDSEPSGSGVRLSDLIDLESPETSGKESRGPSDGGEKGGSVAESSPRHTTSTQSGLGRSTSSSVGSKYGLSVNVDKLRKSAAAMGWKALLARVQCADSDTSFQIRGNELFREGHGGGEKALKVYEGFRFLRSTWMNKIQYDLGKVKLRAKTNPLYYLDRMEDLYVFLKPESAGWRELLKLHPYVYDEIMMPREIEHFKSDEFKSYSEFDREREYKSLQYAERYFNEIPEDENMIGTRREISSGFLSRVPKISFNSFRLCYDHVKKDLIRFNLNKARDFIRERIDEALKGSVDDEELQRIETSFQQVQEMVKTFSKDSSPYCENSEIEVSVKKSYKQILDEIQYLKFKQFVLARRSRNIDFSNIHNARHYVITKDGVRILTPIPITGRARDVMRQEQEGAEPGEGAEA